MQCWKWFFFVHLNQHRQCQYWTSIFTLHIFQQTHNDSPHYDFHFTNTIKSMGGQILIIHKTKCTEIAWSQHFQSVISLLVFYKNRMFITILKTRIKILPYKNSNKASSNELISLQFKKEKKIIHLKQNIFLNSHYFTSNFVNILRYNLCLLYTSSIALMNVLQKYFPPVWTYTLIHILILVHLFIMRLNSLHGVSEYNQL